MTHRTRGWANEIKVTAAHELLNARIHLRPVKTHVIEVATLQDAAREMGANRNQAFAHEYVQPY